MGEKEVIELKVGLQMFSSHVLTLYLLPYGGLTCPGLEPHLITSRATLIHVIRRNKAASFEVSAINFHFIPERFLTQPPVFKYDVLSAGHLLVKLRFPPILFPVDCFRRTESELDFL